jgi:hypothetical protein
MHRLQLAEDLVFLIRLTPTGDIVRDSIAQRHAKGRVNKHYSFI